MLKGLMCRIRASFMWYSNRQKPKSGNMHRKTFPPEQRVWMIGGELFSLSVQASETPILHPRKQAFQKPERASVSEKLPCSVGGISAGPVTFADCSLERMLGRGLRSYGHCSLWQRTRVQVPELTWWLSIVISDTIFQGLHRHCMLMVCRHMCMQNTIHTK